MYTRGRPRIAGRWRSVFVVLITSAVAIGSVGIAPNAHADESEIAAARQRANAAAQELSDAETALANTLDSFDNLSARRSKIVDKQAALAVDAKRVIVQQYVRPATSSVLDEDLTKSVRMAVLAEVALGTTNDAVAEFRASLGDLATVAKQLDASGKQRDQLVKDLATKRKNLEHELALLEEAEAKRQQAAAIQRQRDQALQDARDRLSRGEAGFGNSPIAFGDWICPVQGALSFVDDFGVPRPGGRKHHGVDIMAAQGTLLVAPVSGDLSYASESLGGNTYWLQGDDGLVYYGAHLESTGIGGHVQAGVVIGTVGITGDATAYHLHFQIGQPGGGWYNPYSTLAAHC